MKLRKKIHYLYNYLENQSILYFFRALFESLNFLGRPNPNFLMNPLKNFTNIYTRKKKNLIFFGAGECSSAPAQAEKICLHSKPKVTNRQKIQSTQHTVEVNQPPKKSYIHSVRERDSPQNSTCCSMNGRGEKTQRAFKNLIGKKIGGLLILRSSN